MRCSICLSEMRPGPEGFICTECDTTIVSTLIDQDREIVPSGRRLWDVGIMVAAIILAGFFIFAIVTFAPALDETDTDFTSRNSIMSANQLIVSNADLPVVDLYQHKSDRDIAILVEEKKCQRILLESAKTIEWYSLKSQTQSTMRPALPGNWEANQACLSSDNRVLLGSVLTDGVAISEINSEGALSWTQLITSSGPNRDEFSMSMFDENLFVLSEDRDAGQVKFASFGPGGKRNWEQSIDSKIAEGRPRIVRNSFGDVLLAWKETPRSVRVIISSMTGIVVQDTIYPDAGLPFRGIADDNIGRTLLLRGDGEVSIEIVSDHSGVELQQIIDTASMPIGVVRNDRLFLVFAASKSMLEMRGVDEFGNLSDPIRIEIAESIESGEIHKISSSEVMVTLQLNNAAPIEIVISLDHIAEALQFTSRARAPEIVFEDPNTSSEQPRLDVDVSSDKPIAPVVLNSPEPLDAANLTVSSESVGAASASAEMATDTTDIEVENRDSQVEPNVMIDADSVEPRASENRQARCTFSCRSLDEPVIDYVLMQTVEVMSDETLADVALRLNDSHESLCAVSGGQPVPEFTRSCGSQ